METTHRFSTPIARDLFQLGCESMMDGALHSFSKKPTTLPTASPKEIQDELARVRAIGEHRGTPKEI